jgi:hypothetical protein
LNLWIETAPQSLVKAGEEVCADVVRTFQTEEQFCAVLASGAQGGATGREQAERIADRAAALLEPGTPLDRIVEALLDALPPGEHAPFAILQVLEEGQAQAIECDAPPLFLVQGGQLILPPVLEDESHGRLVRRCRFRLEDGDHVALVSEGYLQRRGQGWSWAETALAVKRLTDTNCDAGELLGALVRSYRRLNPEPPRQDVTILAGHVRPVRTVTVWSGPPADPAQDAAALARLMAEQGERVICGGTTAQIAARLLGAALKLEPRPDNGADKRHPWADVPPVSRLEGVSLVTEGLVTLNKAKERMANGEWQIANRKSQIANRQSHEDGAARLAQALLTADMVHFIVGLAVNPQQVDESGVPLRKSVVEDLMRELKARGKLVAVGYC